MAKFYRIYKVVDNVEVVEFKEGYYSPDTYEKHSATVLVYQETLWHRGEFEYEFNRFSTLEEAEALVHAGETILAVYE